MPKSTFLNLPVEKRTRIIELAIDEFAAHPYRQASLSRIVARAGIAKGSMYQYFQNKLDLYQWLITDELERRKREYLDTQPTNNDPGLLDDLEDMLMCEIGFMLDNPRLAQLAAGALVPTSDAALHEFHTRLRRAHHEELAAKIRQAAQAGEIRGDLDPDTLALMLTAIVRQAVPTMVMHRLGAAPHDLLADPSLGQKLGHASRRMVCEQALDFVRGALGRHSAQPPIQTHRSAIPVPAAMSWLAEA